MSATLTPSTAADRAGKSRPKRSAPPNVTGPALKGLAIFVVLAAFGLGIALVAGATFVFNVVVWLLFTVLWVAFVGALAFSPPRDTRRGLAGRASTGHPHPGRRMAAVLADHGGPVDLAAPVGRSDPAHAAACDRGVERLPLLPAQLTI
jgi:hypothetical protein